MRILLTASQAPFIRGGAEACADQLHQALRRAGHAVERIVLPFCFDQEESIAALARFCEGLDLSAPNGQSIDRVISLQFPGYGCRHPAHVGWLLHQHRAVYELFDEERASLSLRGLRELVSAYDDRVLPRLRQCFTISARVSARLRQFNGIEAEPLYHPPPDAERLRCGPASNYFFFPSRLEGLKRQELVIEAASLLRCPVKILLAGTGGLAARCAQRIAELGVGDRVHLLGAISEAEKFALYAYALGVLFVPFDEDLGYVTLEAMYAAKPVITCTDSGGPLEFVVDGVTGLVVEPSAAALAAAMETLWAKAAAARDMGVAGRERLSAMGLSWERVVDRLCA